MFKINTFSHFYWTLIVRLNCFSQVALRMRQRGYKEGFNAKDTVPYIICYEQVPNTEDQLNTIRTKLPLY